MLLRRLAGLAGVALLGAAGVAAPAHAELAKQAAQVCQQLDKQGVLDFVDFRITRGECVNILTGPPSENAKNFLAGLCGLDEGLTATGTTNKGQCIQVGNTDF